MAKKLYKVRITEKYELTDEVYIEAEDWDKAFEMANDAASYAYLSELGSQGYCCTKDSTIPECIGDRIEVLNEISENEKPSWCKVITEKDLYH